MWFLQNEYKFSGDYVVVRGVPVYNELKDHSVFTVKLFKYFLLKFVFNNFV